MGQALHDRSLSDTGLPNQNRIILGPTAKNLDDALDFGRTPNHRVKSPCLRKFGEIATESLQGRSLGFAFGIFLILHLHFVIILEIEIILGIFSSKIRINLGEHLVAGRLEIHAQAGENTGRHSFAFAEQTKENVFGPNVRMVKLLGLLVCQGENLFHTGCIGNVG